MSMDELNRGFGTHDWWRAMAQQHADIARRAGKSWADSCSCAACQVARVNAFEPVVTVVSLSLPNQALLTANALMVMDVVLSSQSDRWIGSIRESLTLHADDLRRSVEQDTKETGELVLLMARHIQTTATGQSQLVEHARRWLESHAPELLGKGGVVGKGVRAS